MLSGRPALRTPKGTSEGLSDRISRNLLPLGPRAAICPVPVHWPRGRRDDFTVGAGANQTQRPKPRHETLTENMPSAALSNLGHNLRRFRRWQHEPPHRRSYKRRRLLLAHRHRSHGHRRPRTRIMPTVIRRRSLAPSLSPHQRHRCSTLLLLAAAGTRALPKVLRRCRRLMRPALLRSQPRHQANLAPRLSRWRR